MRSLSITALMILAAFFLGLALGGQAPREAAAQEELPEISWDVDGDTLILVNNTTEKGYLARGSYPLGSEAKIPPAFTEGILKVDTRGLSGITIYDLHAIFECNELGCRSCDESPTLCEMPPRPFPPLEQQFLSVVTRGRDANRDW